MRRSLPRAPFHLLRASALAAGTLALAAGAHVAGGGQLPAPGILLAVLALTALASTAATRLRLSLPAIGALLGSGQLALHEVLSAFSAPLQGAAAVSAPGHVHSGSLAAFSAFAPLAEHLSPADPGRAPLMLAAHAAATLGCALLLAKGEAALWALAAWLRPFAGLPRPVVPVAAVRLDGLFRHVPLRRSPWRNLRQDSRRGPPSAVVLPL
ncbi:hypothetical protein QFZ35_000115 [Arthrobacter ulcerisalmonis]|uniref:hypothetical protein n=1 Tax=Arthrobacter sp. B1I2 TaxID=3042263 RepID=UPI00278086E4|nr:MULTISPECIES: hypothetical protein [Arthrobacter]MDQ0661617.1 hypothetical protein [Arthrobacter ulcerisalmonis]MDQ0729529.1 hypothetical protein [Arthrobacter sp. B1I2]